MKTILLKVILIFLGVFILTTKTFAATTYDWYGGTSTAWNVPGNWKVGGTIQTTNYPGSSSATDIVQIGVNTYSNTKQPVLSTALSNNIGSITFGVNGGSAITLTVTGVTLTVNGNIQQAYAAGTTNITTTYNTTLTGTGTIVCKGDFIIGNTTVPASKAKNGFIISSQIKQLTIVGNLVMNAVGNGGLSQQNYPAFNLDNNTLTLDGQFDFTVTGSPTSDAYAASFSNYSGYGLFAMVNPGNTNSVTLELVNNAAIPSMVTGFIVDFDNAGPGTGTVIYDSPSGIQKVYTNGDYPFIGGAPDNYDNLTFAGASKKQTDGGNLNIGADLNSGAGDVDFKTNNTVVSVGDDWTNSSIVTAGSGSITVTDDWTNSSTFTGGSGNITVKGDGVNSGDITLSSGTTKFVGNFTSSGNLNLGFGNLEVDGDVLNTGNLNLNTGAGSVTLYGNYTNNGNFTAGTGNISFAGTSQVLKDGGTGTKFNNVFFNGGGGTTSPAVLTSGNFSVSSSGILTITSSSYLNANGNLTLNSDVTGSATLAAITSGNGITGTVKLQRFIKGSTDLTKRGFRLMSSAVYTGTSGGSNVFDFSNLTNSIYVSGLGNTTNGFNMPNANINPSIYLFREDVSPPPSNSTLFYTAYNWKGVAKINNSPAYNIGMPSKTNTTNANNLNYTVPVGNGFLMFFRGDKTPSTVTSPYSAPNSVTLTQTGALNTGTVNVKLWYAPDYTSLGNNFTFTTWTGSTSTLQDGYTLVGNPYASTINWEKYNRNSTKSKSSIYGGGTTAVSTTIWVLNVQTKQYESYTQKATTITSADTISNINPGTTSVLVNPVASNMIASGQGFFVKATAANQTLSFRETAKTTTQPDATKLNVLMGKPKELVAQPLPSFHLKLAKDSLNTDEIAMRLSDNASTKFVVNEDAEDMGGEGPLVSLSAFSSDSVALSIDFVPFPGKQQEVVRLLVDGTASGPYKLINNQLANLPALYEMWLKDAFANDSLKMVTNATYNFNIDKNNPATFGSNRFSIIIRQNPDSVYKLLDFTATKVSTARQVQLVWNTKNEQSYTNFTVEHSIDNGKTFTVLGGMHSTGAGTYSLLDKNPINGQNLYRLKQEDINNTITYSQVATVIYTDNGNTADKVRVYPNPAVNTINVAIAADVVIKPPYTIQITNSSGFLIKQVTSADANWQSSITGLLPGTYIIKVHNSTDNSFIGDTKFVKL